jgi:hypothetical protein
MDWIERPSGLRVPRVFVSAVRGSGLELLRSRIVAAMREQGVELPFASPPAELSNH